MYQENPRAQSISSNQLSRCLPPLTSHFVHSMCSLDNLLAPRTYRHARKIWATPHLMHEIRQFYPIVPVISNKKKKKKKRDACPNQQLLKPIYYVHVGPQNDS